MSNRISCFGSEFRVVNGVLAKSDLNLINI